MPQTVEERLQTLEDREAIRDLIASYGPMADAGDAEGLAALFTEDGVYTVGGMGEAVGHAAIAALIESDTHRQLMADGCAHLMGPIAITLQGDKAIACGHSIVIRHKETAFEIYRAAANRWQLKRTSNGWRVTRRDNALLNGDAAARALFTLPTARHRS